MPTFCSGLGDVRRGTDGKGDLGDRGVLRTDDRIIARVSRGLFDGRWPIGRGILGAEADAAKQAELDGLCAHRRHESAATQSR
jgi:hypothetical protein